MSPARKAAPILRGVVVGHNQVLCAGPGHSPNDQSLSVLWPGDSIEEFVVHSFADDDARLCRDYIREKLGLPCFRKGECRTAARMDIAKRIAAQRERGRTADTSNVRVAQSTWAKSIDPHGTLVEVYLASRGIRLGNYPATMRFLPASPPRYLYSAMVAAFGIPSEPEPGTLAIATDDVRAVQLTYLRSDGSGKADTDPAKKTIGRGCVAPIVLAATTDSLALVIAEGIEDALSLHVATGVGAWAAGGAVRLPALADAIPDFIDTVTIAVDDNPAGHRGSVGLRDALLSRLPHVNVVLLDLAKKDRAA